MSQEGRQALYLARTRQPDGTDMTIETQNALAAALRMRECRCLIDEGEYVFKCHRCRALEMHDAESVGVAVVDPKAGESDGQGRG